MNRKKVLLIAGFYVPGLGYQENGWAKALVQLGAQVKIVASARSMPLFKGVVGSGQCCPGIQKIDGYELQYMSYYFRCRSMTFPRGIKSVIRDFAPDVVISSGVGQIIPAAGVWYKKEFGYKQVSLFGDNAMQRPRNHKTGELTFKGKLLEMAFHVFKKNLYVKTIEVSDVIGYNTDPATKDILIGCLSSSKQNLANKMISLPLGYEADVFYHSPQIRAQTRVHLGLKNDDHAFIYVSKVQPKRKLESLLDGFRPIMLKNDKVKLIIVGFLGDSYETELKEYITKSGLGDRVICLELATRDKLNTYYNAADTGIWHLLPTISLIESTGTGLPLIIPDDPSFSPKTHPKETAEVFEKSEPNGLTKAIENILQRFDSLPDREMRAKMAEKREYKQIVKTAFNFIEVTL